MGNLVSGNFVVRDYTQISAGRESYGFLNIPSTFLISEKDTNDEIFFLMLASLTVGLIDGYEALAGRVIGRVLPHVKFDSDNFGLTEEN